MHPQTRAETSDYTYTSRHTDVLAFLAALISYYAIEKPFLAMRHRLPKPRPVVLDPTLQPSVAFAESEGEP